MFGAARHADVRLRSEILRGASLEIERDRAGDIHDAGRRRVPVHRQHGPAGHLLEHAVCALRRVSPEDRLLRAFERRVVNPFQIARRDDGPFGRRCLRSLSANDGSCRERRADNDSHDAH